MKNKRIFLLNTPVDCLTMDETVERINHAIREGKQVIHTCINAAISVMIAEDEDACTYVTAGDIISADGVPIIWASKILAEPIPERVSAPDLMDKLVKLAHKKGYKIYLFGAEQDIVEKVVKKYSKLYSPELIAGYRNGYYSQSDEEQIAVEINNSGAEMLFVATPSPMKERFNYHFRHKMPDVKLLMGVGGTFDVISGKVKRAPLLMQRYGMEWIHRLIKEPHRLWKRYLFGNSKFIILVLNEYLNKLKSKKTVP